LQVAGFWKASRRPTVFLYLNLYFVFRNLKIRKTYLEDHVRPIVIAIKCSLSLERFSTLTLFQTSRFSLFSNSINPHSNFSPFSLCDFWIVLLLMGFLWFNNKTRIVFRICFCTVLPWSWFQVYQRTLPETVWLGFRTSNSRRWHPYAKGGAPRFTRRSFTGGGEPQNTHRKSLSRFNPK